MAEYHVGFTGFHIMAGTVKKNGREWLNKTNVTTEALEAAAAFLLLLEKEYHFEFSGKSYKMVIEESEEKKIHEV